MIPSADVARLSVIAADRARPLEHIQRPRIALLSAERRSILAAAGHAGARRTSGGGSSATPKKASSASCPTRPVHPLRGRRPTSVVAEVLALTCSAPLGEDSH